MSKKAGSGSSDSFSGVKNGHLAKLNFRTGGDRIDE